MNKDTLIWLGLGGIAVWYLSPIYVLQQLRFNLAGIGVGATDLNYTQIDIDLQIFNPAMINAVITGIQADIYLNGEYFTRLYHSGNLTIPRHGATPIRASLRMDPFKLAGTLWNNVIINNFRDSIITINGSVFSKGRTYPFNTILDLSTV